jgi:hypothetical protein
MTLDNSLSQLREAMSIDFHQYFTPGIRRTIRIDIVVQSRRDDHSPGPAVVVIDVIYEHRLADEGLVTLLDLLGREPVVVVVDSRGDGPRPDVEKAGSGVVGEVGAMGLTADGAVAAVLGGEDLQAGVLDHGVTSPLRGSGSVQDRRWR